MPFLPDDLLAHLERAMEHQRVAHAYLLVGPEAHVLAETATRMADRLLGRSSHAHPDAHWLSPQSKTRRYATSQIRELEEKLYLKPYFEGRKVAVLEHADRMCLGRAEPANAFLKTLEEPPSNTVLILWTSQAENLLATIRSRCVRVEVWNRQFAPETPDLAAFLADWARCKDGLPEIRAYRRAALLQKYWMQRRAELLEATRAESDAGSEETDTAEREGEFAWEQQKTIAALERWYWRQAESAWDNPVEMSANLRAIQAFEQLQESLTRNVDWILAVEIACIRSEFRLNL